MSTVATRIKDAVALTGIVVRQTLDKASGVWTNSPDVIVTGTNPAFDPGSLIDPNAYDWYFSQAPVIGSPNNLYIRGLNYTPTGSQTSMVYLYFAQSDQLLDPTKWQSSGFTVAGAAQNFTALSAISQYQFVVTTPPVMWTPPQPTTQGATYFLISWIDNSTLPKPPVFPTTPFSNLAALVTYIQQNPSLAVLDTIYRGAFLRQYPAQTAQQDGTGAQTSPDLLIVGTAAAPDASSFTSPSSYSPGTVTAAVSLGLRNFVYVRAINTQPGPGTARVYLYWASTSNVSPVSWSPTSFTFAGRTQNWVDLSATAANQVMVSTVPLVWNAPASGSYILIAYVDNTANPKPPDFTAFGYINVQAVTSFVAAHPQIVWVAVVATTAPQPTMTSETAIAGGTGINKYYVGIQCSNVPIDGTVSLSIPGPDAADTIVVTSMKVPDPNAFVGWPVTYPDHFQTSAVLSYTAGATPVGSASIVAQLVPRPGQ